MRWAIVWLVGVPLVFVVLVVLIHLGQHGDGRWPYALPLIIAGILLGLLSSSLAFIATRNGGQPHQNLG